MFNIIEFTYTKSPTDITNRVFLPLTIPNKNYFGIDLTDLDIEDQAFLYAEISEAEERYKDSIDRIMNKYDATHNYRSFNPEKMSNLTESV